jgi:hypothetical protein
METKNAIKMFLKQAGICSHLRLPGTLFFRRGAGANAQVRISASAAGQHHFCVGIALCCFSQKSNLCVPLRHVMFNAGAMFKRQIVEELGKWENYRLLQYHVCAAVKYFNKWGCFLTKRALKAVFK